MTNETVLDAHQVPFLYMIVFDEGQWEALHLKEDYLKASFD